MVSKSSASWKQKRALPPPKAAGLKRRRFWSTLALLASLLFVAIVVYLFSNQYTPKTYVLAAGKTSDKSMALAPARYVEKTWAELESLFQSGKHLRFVPFTPGYRLGAQKGEDKSFYNWIESKIESLQRNDSLIVWINGTGISLEGKPVIVGDNFQLSDYKNPDNVLDVRQILDAMAQWKGPKLLLIDWGQELFEPRLDVQANDFAALLSDVVKNHPVNKKSPVCVMISHTDGCISLVDSTSSSQQSLFSRAVIEGLLIKDRRFPEASDSTTSDFAVPKSGSLQLRNFAEYVIRRVAADSHDYQKPWLLLSGQGELSDLESKTLQDMQLVSLDKRYGRPKGFPKPDDKKDKDKDKDSHTKKAGTDADKEDGKPEPDPEVPNLDGDPQWRKDLHKMWSGIERLREPDPQNYNWSYAALSPLAYKAIVAQAMDIELKCFSVASEPVVDNPLKDWQPQPFMVKPEPEGDVEASARADYVSTYRRMQEARQAACIKWDLYKLVGTLVCLNNPQYKSEIGSLKKLLDTKSWQNWPVARQEFDNTIKKITERIKRDCLTHDAGKAAAVTELLLRCNLLSANRRYNLRKLQIDKLKLFNAQSDMAQNRPLKHEPSTSTQGDWSQQFEKSKATDWLKQLTKSDQPLTLDDIEAIANVDPRDVRDILVAEDAVKRLNAKKEYPQFKTPRQRELWNIVWDDPTIKANEAIELNGSKELKILLTASVPNLSFPQMKLVSSENLLVSVNGALLDANQLLERTMFESSKGGLEQRLTVKLAKNTEGGNSSGGSLELITASDAKVVKRPEPLAFYLPVDSPILLSLYQNYSKDGQIGWYEQRVPLRPFPGRESKFQLRVKNVDRKAHHVEVRLYELPENSKGKVGHARLSNDDERHWLTQTPSLTWQAEVPAVSNANSQQKDGMVVQLTAPTAAAPPAAQQPNTTPPATPSTNPAAGDLSILGGALIATFVDHSPNPMITKVTFSPRRAEELIDAEVQMTRDKTLIVTAGWKDGEVRNGKAAIAPADLATQPLVIKWDTLLWKRNNENLTADDIKLTNDSTESVQLRSSKGLEIDGNEGEVWLDIDGTPRGLVYSVIRDSEKPVKIPLGRNNPRVIWRSLTNKVDGKPFLTYVPFTPPRAKKDMSALIGDSAVFSDLTGAIEVKLAVDLPELPDADSRFKLRMEPKVSKLFRSREIRATMKPMGDMLVVKWLEEDQSVSFDLTNDSPTKDQTFQLLAEGADGLLKDLPKIVADLEAPQFINAEIKPTSITQGVGTEVRIRIRTSDKSEQVTLQALVAVGKPVPPFLLMPIDKNGRGPQLFDLPIDASQLPPGNYSFQVKLADRFGHTSSEILPKLILKVDPPPKPVPAPGGGAGAPPPELKGTLRIVARFSNPNRRARNAVDFKIEPPLENEKRQGDDALSAPDIKAGSYKVTATYSESNQAYAGEKTIVLAKKEDFDKPWEVILKLKD